MKIIKNIIVAFSLFSQIPMPVFEWKEEDVKHNIVFLSWIGIVIGLISWGLHFLLECISLPLICEIILYSLIPLLITGGFHVDGYMDVQDALKSYKSAEEKLEILKDPNIGAFAIIRLLIYVLIWGGAMAVICDSKNEVCFAVYFVIFFMARAISAMASIRLKHAKKEGMLNMETQSSTNVDFYGCMFEALVAVIFVAIINWKMAIALAIVAVGHFIYYRRLCYKQFGGITGDTAGFYITTLEECFLVAIAIMSFFV